MRRTIHVALGENARSLGTLRFDAQGAGENAAFEYDAAWLAATDGFAIDPGLPLVAGLQFHRKERGGCVFHGAIADTEPDTTRGGSIQPDCGCPARHRWSVSRRAAGAHDEVTG